MKNVSASKRINTTESDVLDSLIIIDNDSNSKKENSIEYCNKQKLRNQELKQLRIQQQKCKTNQTAIFFKKGSLVDLNCNLPIQQSYLSKFDNFKKIDPFLRINEISTIRRHDSLNNLYQQQSKVNKTSGLDYKFTNSFQLTSQQMQVQQLIKSIGIHKKI